MDTAAPVLSIIFGIMDVLMWFVLGIVLAIAIAYYIYAFLKYRKTDDEQKKSIIKKKMIKMAVIFGIIIIITIVLKIIFPILQGIFAGRVV